MIQKNRGFSPALSTTISQNDQLCKKGSKADAKNLENILLERLEALTYKIIKKILKDPFGKGMC